MEIVQGYEGVPAPFIADSKDVRGPRFEDVIGCPAEFGAFLSQADHALRPIQHGIWIAPLGFDIYSPITPGTPADDGQDGFFGSRKSCLWFIGPLRGGANGIFLFEPEVLPHADLVTVPPHRRPWQRKLHAMR